jgi:hypothetical protein
MYHSGAHLIWKEGPWKTFPDIKYILEYESYCSSLVLYSICTGVKNSKVEGRRERRNGSTALPRQFKVVVGSSSL